MESDSRAGSNLNVGGRSKASRAFIWSGGLKPNEVGGSRRERPGYAAFGLMPTAETVPSYLSLGAKR